MFADKSIPFYRDAIVAQYLSLDELDEFVLELSVAVSEDG